MNDRHRQSSGTALLKGVAVLGLAAVISKLLGTLQKIPLQNIAGDGVFGIYNAVYPIYIMILTLATAGFPIAVSKFVSERAVQGKHHEAVRVLKIAVMVLMISGIAAFLLLFFGAHRIAKYMGTEQTVLAIQSISFALLLVPVMAALRGYFQGMNNMIPTAMSQVVEQFVRVSTMIALLLYFTQVGGSDSWIAAGATFGSVSGAAAGLAVMLIFWVKRDISHAKTRTAAIIESRTVPGESTLTIIKQFIVYALPLCLGTLVLPMLTLADTFTMPRLLILRGLDENMAMNEFGIYNHGLPLVQLVAMIATSMSAALVPAIAEAKMKGLHQLIYHRTGLIIRFTLMIGLGASFGLAVTVIPMNIMFFKSANGWPTMAILAFTAVFSTLNIVSGSILQGLGAVVVPVRNLLIASVLKIVGNVVLMPIWGINGAAISAVIAFAGAAILNLIHVKKCTGYSVAVDQLFRCLFAIMIMCTVLVGFIYGLEWIRTYFPATLSIRLEYTLISVVSVVGGAFVYLLALFRLGVVSAQEIASFPGFERKIIPILVKIRLVKSLSA